MRSDFHSRVPDTLGAGGQDRRQVSMELTREAGTARLRLMACFDERAAEQLQELLTALLQTGPLQVQAELVGAPSLSNATGRRQLTALLRASQAVEHAGGTLTVCIGGGSLTGGAAGGSARARRQTHAARASYRPAQPRR